MAVATTAPVAERALILGGQPVETGDLLEVRRPYDDTVAAVVHRATPEVAERAVQLAVDTFQNVTRFIPAHRRAELLHRLADLVEANRERLICRGHRRNRQAPQRGPRRNRPHRRHPALRRRGEPAHPRRNPHARRRPHRR